MMGIVLASIAGVLTAQSIWTGARVLGHLINGSNNYRASVRLYYGMFAGIERLPAYSFDSKELTCRAERRPVGMCSGAVVAWGIVGLLFGPPAVVWPATVARWSEVLDAIGRKPSGRVEPADWNVALTWLLGVGLSVFGLGYLVFCVIL